LDTEFKGTHGRQVISNIFGGILQSIIRCKACGKESPKEEQFIDLSLPISNIDLDIVSMLHSFLAPELLEGDNKYFCENCNAKQNAEKFSKVKKAPPYLVLTLNRFYYDPATRTRKKILNPIDYPAILSLPVIKQDPIEVDPEYSLYAVIMHSGTSAEHGHYYCVGRHSDQPATNDAASENWYEFNDSQVCAKSIATLKMQQIKFTMDCAYILFYKRLSSDKPVQDAVIDASLTLRVDQDNRNFAREQEKAIKEKENYRKSRYQYSRSSQNTRKDYDDDNAHGGANNFSMGMGNLMGGPPDVF